MTAVDLLTYERMRDGFRVGPQSCSVEGPYSSGGYLYVTITVETGRRLRVGYDVFLWHVARELLDELVDSVVHAKAVKRRRDRWHFLPSPPPRTDQKKTLGEVVDACSFCGGEYRHKAYTLAHARRHEHGFCSPSCKGKFAVQRRLEKYRNERGRYESWLATWSIFNAPRSE